MNEQPEKLTGNSLDITAENRARLKALFPACFTETRNEKGGLVESIDFERLKAELGTFSDVFESRRERYGMDWPGKKEALRLIQTPSYATLKPCREESVNFDTTENLFIEGDNLEVLKLLQKSYYGKVKMIYIDPPYNTGKEFIYPDNYSESLETYLEYAGLIDGEGKRFSTNTANEGRFHTKWLNMMYPRLYLARNLLRDDGVILVSIDGNEHSNLIKIMNEIFGEENFIDSIVWDKKSSAKGVPPRNMMVNVHEYIVAYQKHDGYRFIGEERSEESDGFKNPDNDPRGPWRESNIKSTTKPIEDAFTIVDPNSGKEYTNTWAFSKATLEKMISEGRILWKDTLPKQKEYLLEMTNETKAIKSNWGVFDPQSTTVYLKNLVPEAMFENPKPINLMKYLLGIAFADNDIVLDFFSGSSTTGDAVLQLNNEDNGRRKFILVQLPEPLYEESKNASKIKTIADFGKERIRRVIKKIKEEQEGKLDLDQSTNQDLGFKVLKLDKSNFRQWQQLDPATPPEKVAEELFKHIDHVDSKATPEDLLYEILLKSGFTPTEKVETKTIAKKQVFSVGEGALLLCLEDEVTKELINAVAELEPMQFICLDSAFHGNDQLKANAVQTFAARNMQKEKHNQIVFKTV